MVFYVPRALKIPTMMINLIDHGQRHEGNAARNLCQYDRYLTERQRMTDRYSMDL